MFLNTFGKVYCKGLTFKLKTNDVDGNLLKLLENYLTLLNLILNVKLLHGKIILASVPHGY